MTIIHIPPIVIWWAIGAVAFMVVIAYLYGKMYSSYLEGTDVAAILFISSLWPVLVPTILVVASLVTLIQAVHKLGAK